MTPTPKGLNFRIKSGTKLWFKVKLLIQNQTRMSLFQKLLSDTKLAWFPGPAMLRFTKARWTTIDSGQNRTES